jgi:hypothetical protein
VRGFDKPERMEAGFGITIGGYSMRGFLAPVTAALAAIGPGLCAQSDQADVKALAAKACEAAQNAYERAARRVITVDGNIYLPHLWSCRLLENELQKCDKPAEKLQALKAHLERMRSLKGMANFLATRERIGTAGELAAEFYVAQAAFLDAQDDRRRRQVAGDRLIQVCQRRYDAEWKYVTERAKLNLTIAPSLESASEISHEWARAGIELASNKRDRLEAAKRYLQQAKQIEELARRLFREKRSTEPVLEAAFFCADAELQVNRSQNGTDARKRDRKLREARRDVARNVYDLRRMEVGGGSGEFELLYQWSTRLRCASLSLAANSAERLSAVAAHRARMTELRKFLAFTYQGREIAMVHATEFYSAEAEILFVKEKAKLDPK